MMSAKYRIDTASEKLDDQVELVTDYKANDKSAKGKCTTGIMTVIVILLLIFLLLLILIGMVGYVIYQTSNGDYVCPRTTSTSTGSTSTQSTELTETHKATLNITQQMTQLLQAIGSIQDNINCTSCTEATVIQMLREMHSEQMIFHENSTEMMTLLLENSENSLQRLINIIHTLSNHRDTTIALSSVIDDILIVVEELLQLQNASSLFNSVTPVSCKAIKATLPNSPSGYYHVNSRNIYCNMEELCGSGGGWTRIAYLDMDDSTESCPTGLRFYQSGDVRACGRPSSGSGSCSPSVKFQTNGIEYSEICGRVIGYQYRSPDGVTPAHGGASSHNDLNSFYVDGISLTRGSPRQHVWTFMCGAFENLNNPYNCPCFNPPGSGQDVQSFVGSHYFCESAVPETYHQNKLYIDDPLWDGKGCTSKEEDCCSVDGLPWFHRQYSTSTTDYLEMRVCDDESTGNEDNPVNFYEIYVK